MAIINVNDGYNTAGTGVGDIYQVVDADVTANLDVMGGFDRLVVSGINSDIIFIGGSTRDDVTYEIGARSVRHLRVTQAKTHSIAKIFRINVLVSNFIQYKNLI